MSDTSLPPGIRTQQRNDGSVSFEARVNRQGFQKSKRFNSVREASAWKAGVDALIENGVDPSSFGQKPRVTKSIKSPPMPSSPAIAENPDFAVPAKIDMTVSEAIDGYLSHRLRSHNQLKYNQITEYRRVSDDWGNVKASDLTNSDLSNYITLLLKSPKKRDTPLLVSRLQAISEPRPNLSAKARANAAYKARQKEKARKEPRTPATLAKATVKKYLTAMKNALLWAAKNHGVQLNKFLFDFEAKTVPAAWETPRDRRLLKGEEERLYAAGIDRGGYTYTTTDWKALIGFALETAMRQQELAMAKWTDIKSDGYKLAIPLPNSKTKKERMILLSRRAREIIELQRQTRPKNGVRIFHQFPNPRAICSAFMSLTERAGLDDFHFHDLRHEATSRLCESSKLSLMEIMEMTGHKTMVTFQGYVKLIAHENDRRLD